MRVVRQWLGIHTRTDWRWIRGSSRPALILTGPLRPGWYMLTVTIQSEQHRCHGVFNDVQSRMLISGRRRRRLVRIAHQTGRFELHGMDEDVIIHELRLVKQPVWRVKTLLKQKLKTLHPAYQAGISRPHSLSKLWSDYNRLLCCRRHSLISYDKWIQHVEHQYVATEQPQQTPILSFAVWLHGNRDQSEDCKRSIESLSCQVPGDYRLLEAAQQVMEGDQNCWIVFLRAGDELAPQALLRAAAVVRANPDAAVIYTDEDSVNQMGRRHSPHFKPAWNPDLLYSDPGYSHAWFLRSDICLQACQAMQADSEEPDMYGLVLEATHEVEAKQIVHLPEVLYHRNSRIEMTRGSDKSVRVLQAFFQRRQQELAISKQSAGGHLLHWPLPAAPPCVSVIIPTRDQGQMLRRCIDSLISHADNRVDMEIIVVDNDSRDNSTLSYLEELSRQPKTLVHRYPGEFNYAAINNEAVALAKGELIALVNNDIEAIQDSWLSIMAAQACRSDIGAVGAKLLYPDGSVQHGGVVLGIGGIAGHAHKYLPGDSDGYQLRLKLAHNISAVTAAALVFRRSCFEEVGGFDADLFPVNYNDVDLCLRMLNAGYRNLFCPQAVLIHHESKSRGIPVEGEASYKQWQKERQAMFSRWSDRLLADPYYSPHLSLVEEDFSLTLQGSVHSAGRTTWVSG